MTDIKVTEMMCKTVVLIECNTVCIGCCLNRSTMKVDIGKIRLFLIYTRLWAILSLNADSIIYYKYTERKQSVFIKIRI